MSETALILSSLAEGILQITFNRPAQRNALNREMYQQLAALIREGSANPEVRVMLLQGQNGYFTAGNDLADFVPVPSELLAFEVFRAVAVCDKPLVAGVEGCAIGVGATLLGHCDVVYAGASTRFSLPFARLGVSAEGASSLWLPQVAGYKRAAEWLLLVEPFTAQQALDAGVITGMVDDGQAVAQALKVAHKLAAQSPEVVQTNKRLLKRSQRAAILDTINHEEQEFLRLLALEPAQQAISSFLAPRKA